MGQLLAILLAVASDAVEHGGNRHNNRDCLQARFKTGFRITLPIPYRDRFTESNILSRPTIESAVSSSRIRVKKRHRFLESFVVQHETLIWLKESQDSGLPSLRQSDTDRMSCVRRAA